jgi:CHAD domain-containing protein
MFRQRTGNSVKKWYVKVFQALDTYLQSGDPEELHTARVVLKRLFTLWRMNRKHAGKECMRLILIWKAVFKEAGVDRSSYVNAILIKKYSLHQNGSNPKKIKYTPALAVFLANRELLEKEQENLVNLASGSNFKACRKFCKKELEQLISLLLTSDQEFWHPARRKAKRIRYLVDLFQATGKMIPEARWYNAIDRLQEHIGKWHDLVQFRSSFDPSELDAKKLSTAIHQEANKITVCVHELFNSCSPECLPGYLR